MNFAKTASNFFWNVVDIINAETKAAPHIQQDFTPATYLTGAPVLTTEDRINLYKKQMNEEAIHLAILQEQFKTKGQFVGQMMQTKGDEREKFMTDFCNRVGLKYQ